MRAAVLTSPMVRITMATMVSMRVKPRSLAFLRDLRSDIDPPIVRDRDRFRGQVLIGEGQSDGVDRADRCLDQTAGMKLQGHVAADDDALSRKGNGRARRTKSGQAGVSTCRRRLALQRIAGGCRDNVELIKAAVVDGLVARGLDGTGQGTYRGPQGVDAECVLNDGNGNRCQNSRDSDNDHELNQRKAARAARATE